MSVVLKSVFAKNFACFADEVMFTCAADESKKEHKLNTFEAGNCYVNKVSYIYGANGAGKTFFCKVVREIQNIIMMASLSMFNNSFELPLPLKRRFGEKTPLFLFDKEYKDKETNLGLELIIDGITYHYEFSIMNNKIIYELLTKKNKRTEKLLERKSPDFKDIALKSELKEFEKHKSVVKDDSLALVMARFLNNDLADLIIRAITSICVISMTQPYTGPVRKEAFDGEKREKFLKILQQADPTLCDLEVEFKEEKVNNYDAEDEEFENRAVVIKKTVEVKTKHVLFDHGEKLDNETTSLNFFKDESLGTVKLFTALPSLFDALEQGKTLILDEVENGLHLKLVQEMIGLFLNEKSNPYNAQLICTTHQPLLINENVKRDQVWIVTKDEFGKSSIHRLSEKTFSKTKVNLSNKIIEGVFGCNPEKFFSFNE